MDSIMRESVVYQRIIREGREQERERTKQQMKQLILRQLQRWIGEISETQRSRVETLSFEQILALGEALMDFEMEADLERWLEQVGGSTNDQ